MTALIEHGVATPTTEKITLAQYMALPDNGKRYELRKGELVEMPGPSISHAQIITKLARYLDIFAEANGLGQVFSDGAFIFDPKNDPNTAVRPDVAFVTQARFEAVGDYDDVFPGISGLAVEIVSRTDYLYGVSDKIEDYLRANVRLVWVVNPRRREIFVYELARHGRLLDANDELDGGEVLPGFKLKVSEIFRQLRREKNQDAQYLER